MSALKEEAASYRILEGVETEEFPWIDDIDEESLDEDEDFRYLSLDASKVEQEEFYEMARQLGADVFGYSENEYFLSLRK